jgi:SAGA-associated factor 29
MVRPINAEEDVTSMWVKFHESLNPIRSSLIKQEECYKTVDGDDNPIEERIKACDAGIQTSEEQKKELEHTMQSLEMIINVLEKANEKPVITNSPLTRSRRNRGTSFTANTVTFTPGMSVAFKLPYTRHNEGGDWIQCIIIKVTGEGAKQR